MHKERYVRRVALVAAAVVLSLCFAVGSFPANARGEEVELWAAATTEDLKNDEIWLTQSVSGKCTLSGTNWTFKADSYAIRSEISETLTNFVVDAVVTAGRALLSYSDIPGV